MKALQTLAALGALAMATSVPVEAQSEGFIGQVKIFPMNECPRGWTQPEGQALRIADFQQAYEYMGTTFGGDGVTTFALPNLDTSFVSGAGAGPDLTPVALGLRYGTMFNAVTADQIPTHNHDFLATSTQPRFVTPHLGTLGTFLTAAGYAEPSSDVVEMNSDMVETTGRGDSISVVQPYFSLLYCLNVTAGVMPVLSEEE